MRRNLVARVICQEGPPHRVAIGAGSLLAWYSGSITEGVNTTNMSYVWKLIYNIIDLAEATDDFSYEIYYLKWIFLNIHSKIFKNKNY